MLKKINLLILSFIFLSFLIVSCGDDGEGEGSSNLSTSLEESTQSEETSATSEGECVEGDKDGDKVCDDKDNCPNLKNEDQADSDQDNVGDICDSCPDDKFNDKDNDGYCEGSEYRPPKAGANDNCPDDANSDQADNDNDGDGDECDNDDDNDGILDDGDGDGKVSWNTCKDGNTKNCDDNCQFIANPDQADKDKDGKGDLCDDDDDNDGVPNDKDNCKDISNPTQEDKDGDKIGDICEKDNDFCKAKPSDVSIDISGDYNYKADIKGLPPAQVTAVMEVIKRVVGYSKLTEEQKEQLNEVLDLIAAILTEPTLEGPQSYNQFIKTTEIHFGTEWVVQTVEGVAIGDVIFLQDPDIGCFTGSFEIEFFYQSPEATLTELVIQALTKVIEEANEKYPEIVTDEMEQILITYFNSDEFKEIIEPYFGSKELNNVTVGGGPVNITTVGNKDKLKGDLLMKVIQPETEEIKEDEITYETKE